jgi:hypothetical protein
MAMQTCPNCKAIVEPDALFCGNCSYRLQTIPSVETVRDPPAKTTLPPNWGIPSNPGITTPYPPPYSQQSNKLLWVIITVLICVVVVMGGIITTVLLVRGSTANSGNTTSPSVVQTPVTTQGLVHPSPTLAVSPVPPSPTAIPTATPSPTPIPASTVPSLFAGTLQQEGTLYQVRLEITNKQADGSFQGKWFAVINGTEEDVFVHGVIIPFTESSRYGQLDQQKVQRAEQGAESSSKLLWFTSTSYDVGQDIWLGCTYYNALQPDGYVQGTWYAPDDSEEGPVQLHP